MRFEADNPIHKLIKKVPHIAFEVDNLDFELNSHYFKDYHTTKLPFHEINVVMKEHNGTPVERIECCKIKD